MFQPLPRVPKLFQPSVACPQCQHPNDEDFKFCQRCGYQRKCLSLNLGKRLQTRFPVREEEIATRMKQLSDTQSNSRYAKQKSALELELCSFLASLETPRDMSTALPGDIVAFLIWKDQGGKTVVHKPECKFVGNSKYECDGCPKRLAHGTVESLIGKLRAIFAEAGRGVEWHALLGVGNPAADRTVKNYLISIRAEQLKAHVTPRQAEPVLLSDLEVLARHIHKQIQNLELDPLQLYLLARDQAVFKALFFSADRAADLLGIMTPTILRFPDNSGLLFNQIWTKSLRSGESNVYALKRGSNRWICPVTGLEMYLNICKAIKVDVRSGFLFRAVSRQGTITQRALEPTAAQARLRLYVNELRSSLSSPHLTLHGFRSGAAISMALADVTLDQIMDHVGWKTSKTALHYIKLKEVLNPAGPAGQLANIDPDTGKNYKAASQMKGFLQAFPK